MKPKPTYSMRTFYTIVLTQVFSLIGSRISGLAIGIHVFNDTGDATPLALVAFFALLPMVLMSGLAGVLADRWNRRYVMALADAGQAFATLLLLLSFASGQFELWHLYVLSFIQSVFGALQGPAFMASVTMLVPDEKRDRANAIQQMTGPSSGIIAPVLAGLLYAAVGVVGSIIVDLVTFAVAFFVILAVNIPQPEETDEGREQSDVPMWRQLFVGLTYLWQRRTLFWVVIYITFVNFIIGGVAVLLTPYLLARTGDEAQYGILMSLLNVGSLVGSVIMGAWGGTRPRIHTIMLGALFVSIPLGLLGMAQTFPVLAVIITFALFATPFINAAFMSMIQAKVAPDVQGRVFAVIQQLAMLLMPLAFLLVGPLADNVFEPMVNTAQWAPFAPFFGDSLGAGMGLMFTVAGTLNLILTIIVYAVPAVRRLEADLPDFKPVQTNGEEPTVNPDDLGLAAI